MLSCAKRGGGGLSKNDFRGSDKKVVFLLLLQEWLLKKKNISRAIVSLRGHSLIGLLTNLRGGLVKK